MVYKNHYQILGVTHQAPPEEIREAFRRLSMNHHPDRNDNSRASNEVYRIILNAYKVLSSSDLRKEYDRFLETSSWLRSRSVPSPSDRTLKPPKTIETAYYLEQINMILWEVEDFLDRGIISRQQMRIVLIILTFLDRWILHPAGFPDYFMEARRLNSADPRLYIDLLSKASRPGVHLPYTTLDEYFYDVRRRCDRFIDRFASGPGRENPAVESLKESILEFSNLSVHYLGVLNLDEHEEVPRYNFENSRFDYKGY